MFIISALIARVLNSFLTNYEREREGERDSVCEREKRHTAADFKCLSKPFANLNYGQSLLAMKRESPRDEEVQPDKVKSYVNQYTSIIDRFGIRLPTVYRTVWGVGSI